MASNGLSIKIYNLMPLGNKFACCILLKQTVNHECNYCTVFCCISKGDLRAVRIFVGFWVLTAVVMKISTFLDIMPHNLSKINQRTTRSYIRENITLQIVNLLTYFKDNVSGVGCIASNELMIVNNKLKICERNWLCPELR
jgi:hypothetical protein